MPIVPWRSSGRRNKRGRSIEGALEQSDSKSMAEGQGATELGDAVEQNHNHRGWKLFAGVAGLGVAAAAFYQVRELVAALLLFSAVFLVVGGALLAVSLIAKASLRAASYAAAHVPHLHAPHLHPPYAVARVHHRTSGQESGASH
jgi:hypothetical protein